MIQIGVKRSILVKSITQAARLCGKVTALKDSPAPLFLLQRTSDSMLQYSLLVLCLSQTVDRNDLNNDQILLLTGPVPGMSMVEWGDLARDADHATVAINNARDICVDYHTDRNSDLGGTHDIKQVEIALLRYDLQSDSWTRHQTELLGYLDNVLGLPVPKLKCERPDVIAVGDKFFVVWTRRYDRTVQPEEPAMLEAAWLAWDASQSKYLVHATGIVGRGHVLDYDLNDHDLDLTTPRTRFYVRECAGVPDAVVLAENIGGVATVGVTYPHQYDFGDIGPTPDTRLCELRFVTCSFDGASVTHGVPQVLLSSVPFDGLVDTAGFVLPDLARGYADGRFILTFEEQKYVSAGSATTYGSIWLYGYQHDFGTGAASFFGSHQTGFATHPAGRRRPNVSSRPIPSSGLDEFSLAFNLITASGDLQVVYEQWIFSESGNYRATWPYPEAWPNIPSVSDFRPVPLHGTTSPFFRRCYAETPNPTSGCDIREYLVDNDPNNNVPTVLATVQAPNGRPAASYWFEIGATSPHHAAVTWEGPGNPQSGLKIWIRVR